MTLTTSPDVVSLGDAREPASSPAETGRRQPRSVAGVVAQALVAALAGVLYTVHLSHNGAGNSFYAAGVRSASESWKAFFFGSLDPGSFLTIDKPPVALWVMGLSARVFGYSSWSILLPNAIAGVGAVVVLYNLVRRGAGEVAALLAALALALTPVATLMFRYDNPDAILTFFLVAAAGALFSAIELGSTRWMLATGVLLGLAFMTKTLAALIVLPGFGLSYLVCGPRGVLRRLGQLLVSGVALAVSGGWWLALVQLWPAQSRPFVGSTSNNSELSLAFGYNGVSRVFGSGKSDAGPLRLLNDSIAGQVSWLLPLALGALVVGLWASRHGSRISRAGYLLFGSWLLVGGAIFSESKGLFHSYYTVAIAPAVAALAAAGAVAMWQLGRHNRWWAWVLPAAVAGSTLWAHTLLVRTPHYDANLAPLVLGLGLTAAAVLLVGALGQIPRVAAVLGGLAATAALLAGPVAYSLTTIGNVNVGSSVTAGPHPTPVLHNPLAVALAQPYRPPRRGLPADLQHGLSQFAGTPTSNVGVASDIGLVSYLEAHQHSALFLVAINDSPGAAPLIVVTGRPVIALGGYHGTDPAPTKAQFATLVSTGRVHYALVGTPSSPHYAQGQVDRWIIAHGTVVPTSAYGGNHTGLSLYRLS
jgi:4-amino-4-deoxy-L-arabinose transferase-like glycosyltransferase